MIKIQAYCFLGTPCRINYKPKLAEQEAQLSQRDRATHLCQLKSYQLLHMQLHEN